MEEKRRRIKVTWTMDPQVAERVSDAAWADRMSASRYVERAVLAWLEEHPPASAPPSVD